jgi:hypothetical protein
VGQSAALSYNARCLSKADAALALGVKVQPDGVCVSKDGKAGVGKPGNSTNLDAEYVC